MEAMRYLVSAVGGRLSSPVDVAITEAVAVDHLAVAGEGEAAHAFVLVRQPVQELVEFGVVQRLRRRRLEQRERERDGERDPECPSRKPTVD
jgi:hypothetical protein